MSVAAIVVAYRDPGSLDRCLRSLEAMQHVTVANVTADRRVARVVERHGRNEVPIEDNVGYAGAVNRCVRGLASEADTVFFMNDDVEVVSGLPTVGCRSVLVPLQNGRPDLHRLPSPVGFVRGWILGQAPAPPSHGERLPRSLAANGAALVAPRELLESVPLPEEYFMYWEETAWFWRIADRGETVRIADIAVARPEGRREYSALKSDLLGRNLVRLGCERYGRRVAPVYVLLGVAWVLRLTVTDILTGKTGRVRARWRILNGLRAALVGPRIGC